MYHTLDQLEKLQLRRPTVAAHRPAFPKDPKLPNEPNLKIAPPAIPDSREGQSDIKI
jgi:hypothetical protein